MTPFRQIRARYDARTIVVYQAFSPAIARPALEAQRFVAPFSFERMTWVKPSFLLLMERSGWATKPNQESVLAVHVWRDAFDAAVARAVPTDRDTEGAAIRVQWDPERDVWGKKLQHRSLQLGLGRQVVRDYAQSWITRIEDVTTLVRALRGLRADHSSALERRLPIERPYPLVVE
jgi:Domain of unknown function (DUF4291)